MISSPEPLLSLKLSVNYPRKGKVLRDLALNVQHGEILGFVGQSGSGKSTLALAILGLLSIKRAKAGGSIHFQSGMSILYISHDHP